VHGERNTRPATGGILVSRRIRIGAKEKCKSYTVSFRGTLMKTTVENKDDFLCVVDEKDRLHRLVTPWRPIRKAEYAEVQTLLGRPFTIVD
jgi:hypothetical protein